VISYPVNVLTEYLENIFVLSKHQEQTLNAFKAFLELIFRFYFNNTLCMSKLLRRKLVFFNIFKKPIILIQILQILFVIIFMELLYLV